MDFKNKLLEKNVEFDDVEAMSFLVELNSPSAELLRNVIKQCKLGPPIRLPPTRASPKIQ